MTVLLALVGLILGLIVGVVLLRHAAAVRAEGLFRTWQAEEASQVTRAAADEGRLAGKSSVTADLAGGTMLPFLAADAHFVGHPVHLVAFDGDSEIKAGVLDDLRSVLLITVDRERGSGHGRDDAELIAECVADGRVRWETLRHATLPTEAP